MAICLGGREGRWEDHSEKREGEQMEEFREEKMARRKSTGREEVDYEGG